MSAAAARAARAGFARWARGVVIVLCAALAVLVHHEAPAVAVGSMPSASHASYSEHVMPGMTGLAGMTGMTGMYNAPDSACAAPGMEHCATAGIEVVKLAAPSQGHAGQPADPYEAHAGPVSAGTVGRAPPDLSVLSTLRI
ncbi:hypothetical protein [Streptomyces graminilatus]|uniref:hypothetical protein n=1 Tax=Streptomyces graminilatus TaxID=1464070 RepID=UPI0006E407E7|nr:hypothetical protein [Streptomyces graminilatus]